MSEKYNKVKKSFNRSAKYYDHNCLLQFSVANNLIDLIKIQVRNFDDVIDLGCGTGLITQLLKSKITSKKWYALDISDLSLQIASKRLKGAIVIESSFDNIPLIDQSVDLIFANMSFHWSDDMFDTIQESHRILRPDGLLAFSIPNNDSFKEIRLAIEKLGVPNFINAFVNSADILHMLNNFEVLDMLSINYTFYYGSIYGLLKSIKNVGAAHVINNSHQRLSRVDFEKLDQYFNSRYPDKKIPLSYEMICCLALKQ